MHDCDRRTVKKYNQGYEGKPKNRNKKSKLDIYENDIKEKLELPGATISGTYQYIKEKDNSIGIYSNFYQFVKRKKLIPNKNNKVHLRYETEPGRQLQFDWKEDIKMYNKYGELFEFNIFSSTLGNSRLHIFRYSKTKTRTDVQRCLVETFKYIGGVPKELLTDNMSSIVNTKEKVFLKEFKSFVKDMGTETKKCKPRHAYTKGKDESANRFMSSIVNTKEKVFLKEFKSFVKDMGTETKKCKPRHAYTKGKDESANRFMSWLIPYNNKFEDEEELIKIIDNITMKVNKQINNTIGVPPIMLFQKEKEYLKPLPSNKIMNSYLYDTVTTKVSNESLFYYKGSKYSVPIKFINNTINLKENNNKLYVYYNKDLITIHDISLNKINYKEEHYKEGISSVLKNKEQNEIESIAKNNLDLLNKLSEV